MKGKTELAARTLDVSGIGTLLRTARLARGVLVLNYHRIAPDDRQLLDRGVWSATPDSFEAQVAFLAKRCRVIQPDQLERRLGSRGCSVLITFDDGYRDCAQYALPILRSYGVPATFFLTTGFLDRTATAWWDEIAWMVAKSSRPRLAADEWLAEEFELTGAGGVGAAARFTEQYKGLPWDAREPFLEHLAEVTGSGRRPLSDQHSDWITWDQARELVSAGMTIGAHTVTHPILAGLPPERQRDEVASSLSRLEEELGRRSWLFAYPVGTRSSFDAPARAAMRENGVHMAFSNYGGVARAANWDPLDVPRANIWNSMTPAHFRALATAPRPFARY